MNLPVPTLTTKVAIIALSARPYVKLAKLAGWQVLAVDVFADADTQAMADEYWQWPALASLTASVTGQQLMDGLLAKLSANAVTHIIYGSGFEHVPMLMRYVSQQASAMNMLWLGNDAEKIAQVKTPLLLAQTCLQLGLHFPKTTSQPPRFIAQHEQWLVKGVGACGGTHIALYTRAHQHAEQDYYQLLQVGQSVAALFTSDGEDAVVIGVHQQLQRPNSFAYAGAVALDDQVLMQRMTEAVTKLAKSFNLVGINSLDAIWHEGELTILEINPRLSASASLYASASLFEAHINTCLQKSCSDKTSKKWPCLAWTKALAGYAVIYAKQDVRLPALAYPDWVADVPSTSEIKADMPICSVYAYGNQHLDVINQLKIHIQQLKQLWGPDVSQYTETSFDQHSSTKQ